MEPRDRESRSQLLAALAAQTERLGRAVAQVAEAYDHLDERTAERLEEGLFKPLQRAYGRAQRAVREYAASQGLPQPTLNQAPPPLPAVGVRELVARALSELEEADLGLVAIQDDELYPELSDPPLRAALGEVRSALAGCLQAGRELIKEFGR
jgi:hypothetical protein